MKMVPTGWSEVAGERWFLSGKKEKGWLPVSVSQVGRLLNVSNQMSSLNDFPSVPGGKQMILSPKRCGVVAPGSAVSMLGPGEAKSEHASWFSKLCVLRQKLRAQKKPKHIL